MRYSTYWIEDALSKEQCDEITSVCKTYEKIKGEFTSDEGDMKVGEQSSDVRNSNIAWIKDVNILSMMDYWGKRVNRDCFGFNLSGPLYDVQFTEYDSSYKGHYDWHIDWFAGGLNTVYERKLSMILQLSDGSTDYSGGDFEIKGQEGHPSWRKKGTMLFFPSFLLHKVSPVTEGTRHSLVTWFEGPPLA